MASIARLAALSAIVALAAANCPDDPDCPSTANCTVNWYNQTIDHFNWGAPAFNPLKVRRSARPLRCCFACSRRSC